MKVTETLLWKSADGYSAKDPLESYNLIYNESLLLLNKEDIVGLTLDTGVAKVKWILFFRFVSNASKKALSIDVNTNDRSVTDIYFNNWYADDWVENKEPIVIESKDKTKRIFIKIRSTANRNTTFRSVIITIWTKR